MTDTIEVVDPGKYLSPDALKDERLKAIVMSDPERYVIYRGGMICDRYNGNRTIGTDSSLNPHALVSTTARDIARKRQERAALAAAQGILDSVNAHGVPAKGSIAAWGYIVKHQTDIALDAHGRTSTDASYFIGRAAGMLRDGNSRDDSAQTAQQDETMSKLGQVADILLDAIERERVRRSGNET